MTTTAPKPIETRYAGCRFRSRLEARHAVWFDHLGIDWLYEPEGYEVGPEGHRRRYLPDFYLPRGRVWVEVKGHEAAADFDLLADAAHPEHGLPIGLDGNDDLGFIKTRVVVLGPVPEIPTLHYSLTLIGQSMASYMVMPMCRSHEMYPPPTTHDHVLTPVLSPLPLKPGTPPARFANPPNLLGGTYGGYSCQRIWDAYTAARSARFEHGEQGSPTPHPDDGGTR